MLDQDPHLSVIFALESYRSSLDQYMSMRARTMGLHPTDISAMSYIHHYSLAGRCITPGELGQRLALSGPATTAVIDRLERIGYVQRRQSPTDGRRVEIHVALEDQSAAAAEAEPILAVFEEVLSSFSPEQIQALEAIVTTLALRTAQLVEDSRPARRRTPAKAR